MALPKFRSVRQRRSEPVTEKAANAGAGAQDVEGGVLPAANETSSDGTLTPTYTPGVDIKRATRTRRNAVLAASVFFFISVVFLILTSIGGTYNKPVLRDTYFFSLDLSNIFPASVPDAVLINSITRTLGLHDFYQVGLWGFCEGYDADGVTFCSEPQSFYAFNPVEILLNELLAGATIALPAEINTILDLVKVVSHIMFGFFLTGTCINFVAIFLSPLALYSRWWSLPLVIFFFIGALLTTAATIIATVYAIIFKTVITSQADLSIGAKIGTQMFGFMWAATLCVLVAFIIHLCLSCCCASRRDVKRGKKRGSRKAYGDVPVKDASEKRGRFHLFSQRAA